MDNASADLAEISSPEKALIKPAGSLQVLEEEEEEEEEGGAPGVCGLCHQARCASPGQAIRERKAPKRSFSEFSVVNGAALRWNILGPVQGKPTPYSATAGEN
ncbi:hypothetical protein LMH87_001885 [Akanthomyces muscarius]|uniref:Uncharacterized protein n=1 Tax=Akanthomyces muscarius TaxID=2231603 RepID=A0A9W8Q7P6_AKAMU|nr:hypothetical protein LMH87_001885 [Akanthomyces muscarius]KAJ4147356.1 hypothetical protein LMH87_001885 [Akanthomyces muscarius]